jgi:CRP/FNR family transcriptional regulator
METAAFIGNVPLFKGLPSEQIDQLASIALFRLFKRGETIFAEGEDATGF